MIAAAETAIAFLGPLQLLTNHFMEKAAMRDRGDLIVAVDDQRIRSQADFNDALAKARPGDTLYLTVIRPLSTSSSNMDHQTLKVAVTVGRWQPGTADSCTDATTASAQPPSP
jgi:S1-C subfamily serine protease